MKVKRIFVAVLVMLLAGTFGHILGKDIAYAKAGAKAEAKAMVLKAEEFIKANGKEAAIAEINKQDGQFVKDYFYVFAYDLKGRVIADPFRSSLRGKNVLHEKDSKGKLFRKEIVEKAKAKGEGWVAYTYIKPRTKNEKTKTIFFKKVDDMIICCDAY
jgi:signal transduction histidine kinase